MTPVMYEAWKAHRMNNPQSRAPQALILVKNTGATKQQGCVLCGARGPTWSAMWPKTRKALDWEYEHDCSQRILQARYNPTLAFTRLASLGQGEV